MNGVGEKRVLVRDFRTERCVTMRGNILRATEIEL